ncbi:fumarylacetoacetase [Portibacter marinus]|uniref:fumarylacetoacetase n=1 Tax=Portibacter marinus TaxID=2898660 RepID=UPI001F43B6C6|nr:fumarylacetoacetase [Portibacter marinus]
MPLIIPVDSDFSIHNLPFGVFSLGEGEKRIGIAVGEHIFDLTHAVEKGWFSNISKETVQTGSLNALIGQGKEITGNIRKTIQSAVKNGTDLSAYLLLQSDVRMHLPVKVGDYTDFYSSEEHAKNVGKLYRDPENALMPNWKHLPVAYHGRSSSIIVSGTSVKRPSGQIKTTEMERPVFGPTRALDFELETGFIIGKNNSMGSPVSTSEASEYIFGMVLLNDWSARDIQKWEYVPLGPFLGKNFATSISPWVVTYEALQPFNVAGPIQQPKVLPYLEFEGDKNIDINLQVNINGTTVSRSNFKYMYWNMEQQVAHHTINGCPLRIGDLMGSGTISGKDENALGSLLEMTHGGKKHVELDDGSQRKFLEDGDEVVISGFCEKEGIRVGFGEVRGQII